MRHYGTINIREVRKILAQKFPDVQFTFGTAGRGRQAGNCVSWTGGPQAIDIRTAIPYSTVKHFHREMTDAERDRWLAEQDAAHEAWLAGEPARAAARKADGIAKAKATRERKAALRDQLATHWPDTVFTIETERYGTRFAWRDGPEIEELTSVMNVTKWACIRTESQEHKQARIAAIRFARRRDRAMNRPAIIAKALRRRAVAYSTMTARKSREGAQLSLCLT